MSGEREGREWDRENAKAERGWDTLLLQQPALNKAPSNFLLAPPPPPPPPPLLPDNLRSPILKSSFLQ
jgi:hypothetical protein